jgi:hypothetical protein
VTWLREVEQDLPSMILVPRTPEGTDVVDVRVFVDGEVVAEGVTGKPIEVDPGRHVVRYERDGAPAVEEVVIISQGEKNRLVRVIIEQPAPDSRRLPATTMPQNGRQDAVPPLPPLAWVLGGVGVSAVGAGVTLELLGSAKLGRLRSSCAPSCSPADVRSARTMIIAGDVLLASGVVSLGVLAWTVLRGRSSKTAVHGLDVTPAAGGMAATYRGRF